MQADQTKDQSQNAVTQATGKQGVVGTTTLQHPPIPAGASLIERIVLPAVFSVIASSVKNPAHAAELKEYMLAIRDTINAVFPED